MRAERTSCARHITLDWIGLDNVPMMRGIPVQFHFRTITEPAGVNELNVTYNDECSAAHCTYSYQNKLEINMHHLRGAVQYWQAP